MATDIFSDHAKIDLLKARQCGLAEIEPVLQTFHHKMEYDKNLVLHLNMCLLQKKDKHYCKKLDLHV